MVDGSHVSVNKPMISNSSVLLSILLAVIPPALYYAAAQQTGVTELLLVAAFFFSIAGLLLLAIKYSHEIALLSFLRWSIESFATFGRSYRLYFYSFLAFCGGVGYLFKAAKLILGS